MKATAIRDLVGQWLDAWNSHDPDRVRALYAEDAILYQAPVKKTLVGREHIISRFEAFTEFSKDSCLGIDELHISGDTAVLQVNFVGKHTGRFLGYEPTGHSVDIDTCIVMKFKDGRIIKHTTYLDTATVLRALGLARVPGALPEAA